MQKIAFIGAGKMAQAIILGLLEHDPSLKNSLLATTRSEESSRFFTELTGIPSTQDNKQACREADIIVYAAKPQMIEGIAKDIQAFTKGKLVISIAAGVKIATFCELFNTTKVIRVMPNTPLTVGLGASAYSQTPDVTTEEEEACRLLFESAGILKKVHEKDIDAVTALSGSGPAYIFELIRCMSKTAVELGLSEESALALASQTVAGAAAMVQEAKHSPETLRNNVTSPNGTTFAALEQMKADHFEDIVDRWIKKAHARSIELGMN